MTAGIQAIDTDPGAARPAGLRATALRRLRRDPVATARTADGRSASAAGPCGSPGPRSTCGGASSAR